MTVDYTSEWYSGKPLQPGMKCPMCEGYGKWHGNGTLCTTTGCTVDATKCGICNGTGRLPDTR